MYGWVLKLALLYLDLNALRHSVGAFFEGQKITQSPLMEMETAAWFKQAHTYNAEECGLQLKEKAL
jgi:hypothetical protein